MSDKPEAGARRKAQGRKKQTIPATTEMGKPAKADRSPPDGVKALALEYPFALVAGGVAVGVLIGALLPRRQASRLSRPLLAAVGAASEFGLAYAQKALSRAAEAAQDASAASGRLIEAAGDRADDLADSAADQAADFAAKTAAAVEAAPAVLRDSGRRFAESVVRLTSQLRH